MVGCDINALNFNNCDIAFFVAKVSLSQRIRMMTGNIIEDNDSCSFVVFDNQCIFLYGFLLDVRLLLHVYHKHKYFSIDDG